MITCSLHNHCTLCDGRDTPESMLAAAEAAGITDFGMSCHSFCDFDPEMSIKSEREYIDKINALKAAYSGKTRLYLGAEEDYFAPVGMRAEYDYIIGSVHFVTAGDGLAAADVSADILRETADKFYGGDGYALAEEYYRLVTLEAKRKPDILGHFDLIKRYGGGIVDLGGKRYRDIALAALDECAKTGVIFELNYGGTESGAISSPYPDAFLLERIREKGGRVIVSTDCHDVKNIANGLTDGEKYLAALGYKYVAAMRNSKFADERLRG